MATDRRSETNRAAREHLERTRTRIAEGREKLRRLHESIDDTNRHLETMSSWIEETERSLAKERERRDALEAGARVDGRQPRRSSPRSSAS